MALAHRHLLPVWETHVEYLALSGVNPGCCEASGSEPVDGGSLPLSLFSM